MNARRYCIAMLFIRVCGVATPPDQPSTIKQGVDTSFVPTQLKQFGYT